MIEISEVKRRILSELQEAGEENVPTILNTITERTGEREELEIIKLALKGLVLDDLIRAAVRPNVSESLTVLAREASLELFDDLASRLHFRESDHHWTCTNDPWPELVATTAGLDEADGILRDYGYQWWLRG